LEGEENAEDKIKALDEMHQKYKFMEASLDTRCVSRIQCCGSEIRCLFDPSVRDPGWVKNQDPDPG
jgi:hypothetical protein